MSYFITFSSAGLGNILLPYISGLILCRKTKRHFVLIYGKGTAGDITFDKLIEANDPNVSIIIDDSHLNKVMNAETINYYRPPYADYTFSNANDIFAKNINEILTPKMTSVVNDYDKIINDPSDCVCAYSLGQWITNNPNYDPFTYHSLREINKYTIKKEFKTLTLNKKITDEIATYNRLNRIDNNTFGIHFRLTDVKNPNDYIHDVARIKSLVCDVLLWNENAQFFISSDEANIENEFVSEFGDIKMKSRPKKNYPQIIDGLITRDELVMQESFIDLLILSSTTFIQDFTNTPNWRIGTFYSLARALSNDVKYITGKMRSIPSLSTESISAPYGFSYAINIYQYTLIADPLIKSELVIFEDGVPLSFPHSPHTEIRDFGKGRYSHWDTNLYFSTSDNSDPRTNSREYKFIIYN
ncbi:MAG: hypothetical protein Hyperionvirus21_20 [Hyperionvirus sp.]|uniref:Uncharacterized protein n=1 Tax=Hyperionvirus sp. TaxID=2487770 RepID=A0A3G5AAM3_9VIRU|nr:MAG: hypothetical protein Hyperionvirus21_20 [Hyperionvirus sp.]